MPLYSRRASRVTVGMSDAGADGRCGQTTMKGWGDGGRWGSGRRAEAEGGRRRTAARSANTTPGAGCDAFAPLAPFPVAARKWRP